MATEYIGQKPTFTALPNWLRGKATPLELAVMWCLQSHFPNIHPGLELLHKEAGMAKSTLCLVLTGLERKGWVRRERAFLENGRSTSTRYRLTIWETHWQVEAEQSAQSVRETDRECPGDGQLKVSGRRTGSVRETDRECPGDGQEVDKSKKINSKKALEPPLPPSGGNAGEGQGELITVEALPVDAALSKSTESAKVPEPPPQTMALTKPRKPRFQPTADDIPADLLPVQHELLAFWPTRSGQMTPEAWTRMLGQARQIQQDQRGGTEILRGQLEDGIAASIDGKRWQSLKFKNWELYGPKAGTPAMRLGNRRKTPEEHAADSIAFIEARDARRAAAASAPGQTLLCEVLA
jgi:hypothetical protein